MEAVSLKAARRFVLAMTRESSFVPLARGILAGMGYEIVDEKDWSERPELLHRRPELVIVDEHRWAELEDDPTFSRTPVLLITGKKGARDTVGDGRVLGAIHRPAGLHELFQVFQQVFESRPRNSLRVPTHLPARLRSGDREWRGAVLSLSENGCLLRSHEPLHLGSDVSISFQLPNSLEIETRAASTYQLLPDTGLVFCRTEPSSRDAIRAFVEAALVV